MLRSFFLLNGFSRAFIPPIEDEPDTCEIFNDFSQVNATESTPWIIGVCIGSLVMIVLLCYLWYMFERKNNKK